MKSKEKTMVSNGTKAASSTGDSEEKKSEEPIETIDMISSDEHSGDDDEDYIPDAKSQRQARTIPTQTSAGTGADNTLVVAPLSLIAQWEEEISTKTNLSCLVYYGDARAGASTMSFRGVDVVLTTFGTLQGEYLQSTSASSKAVKPTTLLSHQWERIIVDEAHQIKNPGTAVSKSCCSIKATKRWAVTGTPIQNSLQDVYGLMKFLKHEPWCSKRFWQRAITTTLLTTSSTASEGATSSPQNNSMAIAMDRVRRLLHPLILRRTKETIGADGKPILTLPPIDSGIVSVHLTEPEREFYTALLDKSQNVFEGLLKAGTASKSWLAIFSLLQRLRQSCDHVALTVKSRFSVNDLNAVQGDTKGSDSAENGVNKNFLSNLLQMFAKSADQSTDDHHAAPSSPSRSTSRSPGCSEPSSAFISQVVESLTESVDDGGRIKEECPLCLECPDISSAVLTPCAHTMCLDCLRPVLKQNSRKQGDCSNKPQCRNALNLKDGPCPVCNTQIEASRIVLFARSTTSGDITSQFVGDVPMPEGVPNDSDSVDIDMDSTAASARETLLASLSGGESSKLLAVKRELDAIWKVDSGSKILIFSQYLGFLDILGISLRKEFIPVFRLDGQMRLKERVAALYQFTTSKAKGAPVRRGEDPGSEEIVRGSVFLASMKAGGVGINLVAASSVFIVDPWWNAAIEDQCINRIHRIGQKAPIVRVRRFVVADSVEEKIVRLQQKKKSMANDILDADAEGSDPSSGSKPTLDDFKILLGR